MIFAFDNCELDSARMVLRVGGEESRVEPQVFDLLRYLIERRGKVVLKEELLDGVWGDRFVSQSALTTRIRSARRAVGDDGTRQQVIRTVHGRGYEFVADVEVSVSRAEAGLDGGSAAAGQFSSMLPAAVQSVIGRDDFLQRLRADLRGNRLLTLVGPGGVGKTTVGFELARMSEQDYIDGTHVVELVTVDDDDAVLEALATALDVNTRQHASLDDAIVDLLRQRNVLLLVDNCEHLLDQVAPLIGRILRSAPQVSVVATSREALALPGEHIWTVEPLAVAPTGRAAGGDLADLPSVRLFAERSRAVDPTFELDDDNLMTVADICRRLDGIPLAIELAAARVRTIDVGEIAQRLDERFRLLRATSRGSDPRHRTLYDAISWSYNLLDAQERRLFAALTVFAGQFDLEAARSVCGGTDLLDPLARLAERSMVTVRRPAGGGTRYELLETLREYGRSRLDDDESVEVSVAHARYFAATAEMIGADLKTPREAGAVVRGDASFADLRVAQRFAWQIGDFDLAFGLIGSVGEYAMRTLRYEIFSWADRVSIEAQRSDHSVIPLITGISAFGAWVRGEYDKALALADAAQLAEVDPDGVPSGIVERVRANVLYSTGRMSEALAQVMRLIELADDSGEDSRLVHALYMGSVGYSSIGDFDRARELAAMAKGVADRTGSPTDLASAWVAQGFATDGHDEAAIEAFDTSNRIAVSAGNRWMSAFALTEASGLMVIGGYLDEGCRGLAEVVDTWYRAGEWSQQWHTLSRCVLALDRIDRPVLATQVVGAIEAHVAFAGPPGMTTLRDVVLGTREALADQLGAQRTREEKKIGQALPLAELVHSTSNALLGRAD